MGVAVHGVVVNDEGVADILLRERKSHLILDGPA